MVEELQMCLLFGSIRPFLVGDDITVAKQMRQMES